MKTLVIYYSYAPGNTRKIARQIAESLQADLEEISLVNDYTEDFDGVVARGYQEVQSGYMPEIKPLSVKLSDYDTIILGTPVWHMHYSPAMKSFLSKNSLAEKKLYLFATNAGWLGSTMKEMERDAKGATICGTLNVVYNAARSSLDQMKTSKSEIEHFIENIKKKLG